ncbi:hypothetical protein L7F22_018035 [Adiantum nelumboides]|nr:hypothetical protein [Adiantum nelumboides]
MDNLLKVGFITEVESSDWLFPIVVVPKKNGKLRVCVDYKNLNVQTIKDSFPLPFIDMMLDEIAGHEMYSFMDGYSGYNELKIALEDREKTTFIPEWGVFMYLVMPFGLCNAPATFQRCMMEIFKEFLRKFLAIFVDDFTIYSTKKLHILFLEMVFLRCREKRICLNPFKSIFMVWKEQVLGHVVFKNGIEMDANKITCIQQARSPKNVSQLSLFLGCADFLVLRSFLADIPLLDDVDMVMHSQVVLDEDAHGTDVADRDRLVHIVYVLSAFGSLMSDLLVSRPDLAYAVGAFAVEVVTDTGIMHVEPYKLSFDTCIKSVIVGLAPLVRTLRLC